MHSFPAVISDPTWTLEPFGMFNLEDASFFGFPDLRTELPTPPRSPQPSDLVPTDQLLGDLDEVLGSCLSGQQDWTSREDNQYVHSEAFCPHDNNPNSCYFCSDLAKAESELVHDCMWAGTCTSDSSDCRGRTRQRYESVSSRLSDLEAHTLAAMSEFTHICEPVDDLDVEISRPDTPSESSCTDTDEDDHELRDSCRKLGIVELEHNYYHTNCDDSTDNSMSSPSWVGSPSPSESSSDEDDDDEIDVVSLERTDSRSLINFITTDYLSNEKAVKRIYPGDTCNLGAMVTVETQRTPTEEFKKQIRLFVPVRTVASIASRVKCPYTKRSPRKLTRTETMDPEKRNLHNCMERQRRVDLRNCFEELKQLVPEIRDKPKSPKVEILRSSTEYCRTISAEASKLKSRVENLKQIQAELKKRLQSLQMDFR